MHILGCSAWIRVDGLGVCLLLSVSAQAVLVIGLAGHFVDGVWLVGASCRCGARREGLGVEFGGFIGFVDFGAELMLRRQELAGGSVYIVVEKMIYPFPTWSVSGRTVGVEGLAAHGGVDGLFVPIRHFDCLCV